MSCITVFHDYHTAVMINTHHAVLRCALVSAALCIPASVLLTGCAKPEEQAEVQPEDSSVIRFTNIFQTVERKELDIAEESSKTVRADFNLDGFPDLAVVHDTGATNSEVAIYIRKPGPGSDMMEAMVSYYRVGTIRESLGGRIVGIAS